MTAGRRLALVFAVSRGEDDAITGSRTVCVSHYLGRALPRAALHRLTPRKMLVSCFGVRDEIIMRVRVGGDAFTCTVRVFLIVIRTIFTQCVLFVC